MKCVTVPKLIQHADELEQMLEIATDLDLAGKNMISSACVLYLFKFCCLVALKWLQCRDAHFMRARKGPITFIKASLSIVACHYLSPAR